MRQCGNAVTTVAEGWCRRAIGHSGPCAVIQPETLTAAATLDLLQRMHDRLTDGRAVPEWQSGWAEEIAAVIARPL